MPNASKFDDLPAVPKIGIFWFTPDLSGILCGSALPVDEGERYGDYRIFPTSHFDHWEQLNREGFLRTVGFSRVLRDDYSAVPRGRVSFHITSGRFKVYVGSWLQPCHADLVRLYFYLPTSATDFEHEDHYDLSH
jgi:hypothetical protein